MAGKHNKCCCGCIGCCLPYVPDDETCPTIGRRVKTLAWAISAPDCPAIDGVEGEFFPETTCPHDEFGPCGNCICMVNTDHYIGFILGVAKVDNGETCGESPCGGLGFCFNLTCNPREPLVDEEDVEECCSRLKLLVLINGADVVTGGEEVDVDGNECLDATELDGEYTNFIGCPGNEGSVLRQLSPLTCQCEDELDPEGTPFEVVFDLSELGFECDDFFSGGPCDGLPTCCMPVDCTLAGATLTVVVA